MKRIWPFVYAAGAVLCVYGGFLGPGREIRSSDVDWVVISLGFVVSLIAPLGSFGYAILHSKNTAMPRPSLDRHPFGWWSDVLQPLRVGMLATVLLTTGVLIAFAVGRGQPGMVVCMWIALSGGMGAGEWLVYRVYKARIASHSRSGTAALFLNTEN